MTAPLYSRPVSLVTRAVTSRDAYGNDVYTETTTATSGIFAPAGSVETVDGRDVVVDQPTLELPTGTVVTAYDVIVIDGQRYEIDGKPAAWPPNPFTGWQPEYSVHVRLKEVAG